MQVHTSPERFLKRLFVLASGSPRRITLLKNIIPEFEVVRPAVDEDHTVPPGKEPWEIIEENARKKALYAMETSVPETVPEMVENGTEYVVIGCDTVGIIDGRIIGKPADEEDALRILGGFSGRWHEVISGVCILHYTINNTATDTANGKRPKAATAAAARTAVRPGTAPNGSLARVFHETTRVKFIDLSHDEIRDYVRKENTLDKAGAYAIQEHGGVFVDRIEGCYFNVIGLPVSRLYRELGEMDLLPVQPFVPSRDQ